MNMPRWLLLLFALCAFAATVNACGANEVEDSSGGEGGEDAGSSDGGNGGDGGDEAGANDVELKEGERLRERKPEYHKPGGEDGGEGGEEPGSSDGGGGGGESPNGDAAPAPPSADQPTAPEGGGDGAGGDGGGGDGGGGDGGGGDGGEGGEGGGAGADGEEPEGETGEGAEGEEGDDGDDADDDVLVVPTGHHLEYATKMLFDNLDVYDVGQLKAGSLKQLNHRALSSLSVIEYKLVAGLLLQPEASFDEQAKALAQVINALGPERVTELGPAWADVMIYMPEATWLELDPEVIEAMPFEGVVANVDPKLWSQHTYKVLEVFPDRFWENVPMDVLEPIRPGTYAQMDIEKVKKIRKSFLQELQLQKKFVLMSEDQLAELGLEKLEYDDPSEDEPEPERRSRWRNRNRKQQ